MEKERKRDVRFGIRARLMTMFVILITIPLLVLGISSYIASVNLTEGEVENTTTQLVAQINSSILNYLNGIENGVKLMASNKDIKEIYSNPDIIDEILMDFKEYEESYEGINNIYIGTYRGDVISNKYLDTEPTNRSWYKKAREEKKLIWTQPYIDSDTKKPIISLAHPLYDRSNKFIGVLVVDVALEKLANVVNSIEVGDNGHAFIINSDGEIVIYKNEEVGKKVEVKEIVDAATKQKSGHVTYRWRENNRLREKMAAFTTLDKLGWRVFGAIYTDEIKLKTGIILKRMLIFGITSLILALIGSYIYSKVLMKKINKVKDITEKVKDRNLSLRIETKSKDEIGVLSKYFNSMLDNISKLIKDIQSMGSEVTGSSKQLASVTEETNISIEEVTKIMEDLATGANDQVSDTENGVKIVNSLDNKIQSLVKDSKEISEITEDIKVKNIDGSKKVGELREKTESNNRAIGDIERAVTNLSIKINDIGDILGTISSISEQTNLLALNASIEAARAGEEGRGFEVVANEIRKLAEESNGATDEIRNIISNVKEESGNTVTTMNQLKESSKSQFTSVTDMSNSFKMISDSINKIVEKINSINQAVYSVNNDTDLVINTIENISSVCQQTAASTEEVNASMEEQSASMEEVNKAAEKLSGLAEELNREIGKFTLNNKE
ncbi:methyl-accepting chemotaxis protein [Dethiothermospora halolimnae]|uniref:methyl-accepting chemotaxis protein n=1 Tax=Dethiothermospora halolimnae TaxID=3114390 RepID=UPI003CCBEDF0